MSACSRATSRRCREVSLSHASALRGPRVPPIVCADKPEFLRHFLRRMGRLQFRLKYKRITFSRRGFSVPMDPQLLSSTEPLFYFMRASYKLCSPIQNHTYSWGQLDRQGAALECHSRADRTSRPRRWRFSCIAESVLPIVFQ